MPTTEGLFRCQEGYLRLFDRGPWVSICEIQEQWFIGKLPGDLNTQGDRFMQGLYIKVWLCHVLGLHGWGVGKKASESPPKTVNFNRALSTTCIQAWCSWTFHSQDYFTKSYFPWTIRVWNSLPHSVKHATRAQQLKSFLHAHYKARLSSYRSP